MITFLIGLLTAILVLDCLFLGLLVLIQLPKKEAGVGSMLGGGMTDSLLGAGSGNVLTTATQYAAGIFLALALLLSMLKTSQANAGKKKFDSELNKAAATAPAAPAAPTPPSPLKTPPATAPAAAVPAAPTLDASPTAPGANPLENATPTLPGELLGATPTTPK